MKTPDLTPIIQQFQFAGELLEATPYGNGHINDTYMLRFAGISNRNPPNCYVLQRINNYVFKQPDKVMENMVLVTQHLRKKILAGGGDPTRTVMTLIPTQDQQFYYVSLQAETWRAHLFIDQASSYEESEQLEIYYQAAYAFGDFLRQLSDLSPARLHTTIPNFHHTPSRLAALGTALAQDPLQRAAQAKPEIAFIEQRAAETSLLVNLQASGQLPERVTHNDTKLNNVLIDNDSLKGVCVIDLDTTMPGLSLYDFGDAVRSAALSGPEDAQDNSAVGFNLAIFEQLARGYLDATRGLLTPTEIEWLAFSARLITLENGIRFLSDHILGDIYYKAQRPNHNLHRCRTQLKLVAEMEKQVDAMQAIVVKYQ